MASQEEITKALRSARILWGAFFFAPLIYIIIIYMMRSLLDFFIFFPDDPDLYLIVIVLACLSIVSLIVGIYIPRWYIKRQPRGLNSVLSASVIRWSFFELVAVLGLILGISGTRWEVILPFFIASITAIVLTLPAIERWKKSINQGASNR